MRRLLGADSLRSDNPFSLGTPPHCGGSGPIGPHGLTTARIAGSITGVLGAIDDGQLLRIYLNDHLAGATAGVDLARRAAGAASGPMAAELAWLADEIARDRNALLSIMDDLDVPVQRLKASLGWVAEKVGRLKLNGRIVGRSPLSTVVELEGLRMGVQGKVSGWETLRAVDGRVDPARLDELLAGAHQQLDLLARLHASAVARLVRASSST